MPNEPEIPGVSDAPGVADWARAVRLASVDDEEVRRYELESRAATRSAVLDAIDAAPVPAKRFPTAPGDKAAQCDRVAGDPFDRERPGFGVALADIDVNKAATICAEALSQYPDDLPTAYHVARVDERRGRMEAATAEYLALAKQGYAAAMRNLARLAAEVGSAADWRRRALEAGDTVSLFDEAARIAASDDPDRVVKAFTLFDAAGVKNRASAAMAIFLRLAPSARTDSGKADALFYGMLGEELMETVRDPAPVVNPQDRFDARNLLRDMSSTIPAPLVVKSYRDAHAWIAAQQ